jgi:LuxR family quorum sensing-dependent transcriptional regulator
MEPAEMARVALEFVDQVAGLDDETAVRDLLLRHSRALGFDNLIVAELAQPGEPLEVHLCTWPQGFFDLYRSQLYRDDPLARHARATTEPFVWSDAAWDRSRGSPEQRVMDEAAAFGLEDGFVVPVIGVDGDQSVVGLAGRRGALEDHERRALHLMCVYAHHTIRHRRMVGARPASPVALSPVQQDCLAHLFMGRGAGAIGSRLGLPAAGVRRACRDAARILRVTNPVEAAVKAALLGEIHP